MPYCKIGTVEALYWMTSGGVVPGRKLFQDGLRYGGDLGHAGFGRDARLKEYLDDAIAIVGGGFDVLDIIHRRGQGALFGINHALFDVLRRQAGVLPNHADHRNVDGRKDVGGRAQQNKGRQQQQQQGRHDKRVRGDEELIGRST
jgi:hypothetical protein